LVLALVKKGGKVSFGEAWCTLQVDGVRTYATLCKNINDRWQRSIITNQHGSPSFMLLK
jgi:hypothetical protein